MWERESYCVEHEAHGFLSCDDVLFGGKEADVAVLLVSKATCEMTKRRHYHLSPLPSPIFIYSFVHSHFCDSFCVCLLSLLSFQSLFSFSVSYQIFHLFSSSFSTLVYPFISLCFSSCLFFHFLVSSFPFYPFLCLIFPSPLFSSSSWPLFYLFLHSVCLLSLFLYSLLLSISFYVSSSFSYILSFPSILCLFVSLPLLSFLCLCFSSSLFLFPFSFPSYPCIFLLCFLSFLFSSICAPCILQKM